MDGVMMPCERFSICFSRYAETRVGDEVVLLDVAMLKQLANLPSVPPSVVHPHNLHSGSQGPGAHTGDGK